MTDYVIENFHKRKAAGELFFNPMCQKIVSFTQTAAKFTISSLLNGYYDASGVLAVRPPHVASPTYAYEMWVENANAFLSFEDEIGQLRNHTINGAYAKTTEEVMLLYATLGESKETLKMIVDIIMRLRNLLRGKWADMAKPGKRYVPKGSAFTLASKYGKSLSEYWMEARYGIRPLIYELQAAFSLMEASLNTRHRQTVRKRARLRIPVSTTPTTVAYDSVTYLEALRLEYLEYEVGIGVMFSPISTDVSWVQLLGLDQPLQSIWELTRLSFMIDRIIDVGSWIQANEYNPSIVVLGAFQKEKLSHVVEVIPGNLVVNWAPYGYVVSSKSHEGGSSKASTKWVRRIEPTKPSLPAYKLRFNWPEIIDAAIIVKGLMSKH